MRKIFLKIMIMVFFDENTITEKAKQNSLNEADYDFVSGDGFEVVNTEMVEIEQVKKHPNQSLVEFKVEMDVDDGVEVEEILSEIDYNVTEIHIVATDMREFVEL